MCQPDEITSEEIEVLKDEQNSACRDNTRDEPGSSSLSMATFDVYAREVVNEDGDEENENVSRDERHIEDAARDEQHRRPISPGETKIETYNQREEDRELK